MTFSPEALLAFLEKSLSLQQEILCLEEQKMSAVSDSRTSDLLDCVKQEEALSLRARGQEREFLALAGSSDATVRSLLDTLEGEQRDRGEVLYGQLLAVLMDVKELVARCNALCELRLRKVDQLLQKEKPVLTRKEGVQHISKKI